MQGPGIPEGVGTQAMTSHIDLAPTILELAGLPSDGHAFDGTSMMPLFDDQSLAFRDYDFGEYHPTARMDLYNQTVRTGQWRLTLYPQHPEWGELYDLSNDPKEHCNRFGDSFAKEVSAALREVLRMQFPPMPKVDNERICKW